MVVPSLTFYGYESCIRPDTWSTKLADEPLIMPPVAFPGAVFPRDTAQHRGVVAATQMEQLDEFQ